MKITGFGSIRPPSGSKKSSGTSSAGSSSFSSLLALSGSEENIAASQTSDVSAASALSNLLALQEISEDDVKRKKLLIQGSNMLEVLEKLRQQLLLGTLSPQLMQDMSRQLSLEKQLVSDPALNDLIQEIELRLAVELAKIESAKRQVEGF